MTEQAVEVDHMAGYRVLGDTSLGDTLAKIRIGGGAGVQEVPAWADTCLGIYAHISPTTLTEAEETAVWGYLESDDGMSIKPFEFIFPPICSPLGVAGPASSNSTPGEYYAMNAPVRPFSKILAYAQCISGGDAMTAPAYVSITFWFSNSRASGQWAPTSLDPHPGIQRYRKVGTMTAMQTYVNGYIDEAAYQCNLGTGGGVITELGGLETQAVSDAGQSGGGNFKFTSNDVPLFPQTFAANALGGLLGAAGQQDARDTLTRRLCHCEADSVVTFVNSFIQGHVGTIATGDFITFVEFVRA